MRKVSSCIPSGHFRLHNACSRSLSVWSWFQIFPIKLFPKLAVGSVQHCFSPVSSDLSPTRDETIDACHDGVVAFLLSIQVGAINTRLLDVPWLDVRAIDLKSQHPRIEERDFFSLKPSGEYDVVSSRWVFPFEFFMICSLSVHQDIVGFGLAVSPITDESLSRTE